MPRLRPQRSGHAAQVCSLTNGAQRCDGGVPTRSFWPLLHVCDAMEEEEGRTISELRASMLGGGGGARKKHKPEAQQQQKTPGSRHVRWDPGTTYELVRAGAPWRTTQDIDDAHRRGALTEAHLCVFRHSGAIDRNADVPKYEAVHMIAGNATGGAPQYVRAQKCHLHQAYTNSGRADMRCAWALGDDGLPYWVDRYAFCRVKQRQAKSRYDTQQQQHKRQAVY